MLAPVLVYVGRNEGRHLSRRDILLAGDVKGNDFVKKHSGRVLCSGRGKAVEDMQMGACGIVCVGRAMRQRRA